MAKALLDRFEIVRETESLRNKAWYLKSAISKLFEITKDCCEFIQAYFKRSFPSKF